MSYIAALVVQNFRSLKNIHLEELAAANAIVGLNNSGKSNLLRALNLFFNDEVEPGRPLDLAEDHYGPWGNRKKQISVSVGFDLSSSVFSFGKKFKAAEQLVGYEPLIRRTWSFDRQRTVISRFALYNQDVGAFRDLEDDEARTVRSFLGLIKFRYIPNHIHPSTMLEEEQGELQRILLRKLRSRLAKRKQGIEEGRRGEERTATTLIFGTLRNVAERATQPISEALKAANPEIESVELETGETLDDVAILLGHFVKTAGGETLPADLQGSGVQTHLAYQTIHFLDTSFEQFFGTRQAVVWGIEEPESFLHTRLESYLAQFLFGNENVEDKRFQVFCTTHSDIFVRHADIGILVQLVNGESKCETMKPRDLVTEASSLGISRFVHALYYDHGPLILVEGTSDKLLLGKAYDASGQRPRGKIHSLETLCGSRYSGGVEQTLKYLKENHRALKSRPLDSPILVVLDWEVKDKVVNEFRKILSDHPTSGVLRCDVSLANPQLDESFKGIERYLSTGIILHADRQRWLRITRPLDKEYPLSVDRRSLKKAKTLLANYVSETATDDDVQYLSKLTLEIDSAISSRLSAQEGSS